MCDVTRIGVFCSKSTECFLVTASTYFFQPFVTIPVVQIITGIIIDLMFHIRCISICKLVFSFLFCFLLRDISVRWYCQTYQMQIFSSLFLIIIPGLTSVTSPSVLLTLCPFLLLISGCLVTPFNPQVLYTLKL